MPTTNASQIGGKKTSALWKAKYGVGSKKDWIVNFKNLKNQWGGEKAEEKKVHSHSLTNKEHTQVLIPIKTASMLATVGCCKEITLGFSISGCMTLCGSSWEFRVNGSYPHVGDNMGFNLKS